MKQATRTQIRAHFKRQGYNVCISRNGAVRYRINGCVTWLDGAVYARRAADALREKMGWRAVITGQGVLPNGDYVFTMGAAP